MDTRNDGNRMKNVLRIPPEPDLSVRTQVEEAISDTCSSCCCQVELHTSADSNTILYALDTNGSRKTQGGDEFYIRYEEHTLVDDVGDNGDDNNDDDKSESRKEILTQAVAIIHDRSDGSYELDFRTTPMHFGLSSTRIGDAEDNQLEIICTMTVYFEYTNGFGRLAPPSKNDWLNGGYSHRRYEIHVPHRSYRPLIQEFVPPTPCIDLGSFDYVFAFGDSTFCQFFRQRPNKKGKYYFQPNLRILGEKVRMGLNSETVGPLLDLLREGDSEKLVSDDSDSTKKALIVGSCLWDILSADDTLQGPEFLDHYNACKEYISCLRRRYPGVTILWKSPMAVHIHWVDLQRVVDHDRATATLFGINRIKYMSAYRSYFLYKLQKQLMEELGVPMLDLYEATRLSADLLYPSDGRHYKPDLNRKMLSWFYPNSKTKMDKNDEDDKKVYFRQVI